MPQALSGLSRAERITYCNDEVPTAYDTGTLYLLLAAVHFQLVPKQMQALALISRNCKPRRSASACR
jgi:hypothetical protein